MVICSNMSHREAFKLTGSLPMDRIELLLDKADTLENLEDVPGEITEAKAGFPDEDCLQDIIKQLQVLQKNLRGDNRTTLGVVIEQVEERQTSLMQSSEYGLEKLNSALSMLKGVP